MFAPLCDRWSFCHDGLTRWRLLCGQHCGSSKAPRRLHCWSLMTWEVENTPPPNKGDPLKKSFSGSIYNLQTGRYFFRIHRLVPAFSESFFQAKYPALEDARCSTRISSYSAQYGWHHYSLPMLEAQKVGRFFGYFPSFGVLFWDDRHAGFSFNMGWRSYWIGCSCHWHRVQGGINLQKSRISWP